MRYILALICVLMAGALIAIGPASATTYTSIGPSGVTMIQGRIISGTVDDMVLADGKSMVLQERGKASFANTTYLYTASQIGDNGGWRVSPTCRMVYQCWGSPEDRRSNGDGNGTYASSTANTVSYAVVGFEGSPQGMSRAANVTVYIQARQNQSINGLLNVQLFVYTGGPAWPQTASTPVVSGQAWAQYSAGTVSMYSVGAYCGAAEPPCPIDPYLLNHTYAYVWTPIQAQILSVSAIWLVVNWYVAGFTLQAIYSYVVGPWATPWSLNYTCRRDVNTDDYSLYGQEQGGTWILLVSSACGSAWTTSSVLFPSPYYNFTIDQRTYIRVYVQNSISTQAGNVSLDRMVVVVTGTAPSVVPPSGSYSWVFLIMLIIAAAIICAYVVGRWLRGD